MSTPDSQMLRDRTSRSALGVLGEQYARMFAQAISGPVIARSLGPELFGAWNIISQVNGNLGAIDLRSSTALKVMIQNATQNPTQNAEKAELHRMVGAAFVIAVVSSLIILGAGLALVSYSEQVVPVGTVNRASVRTSLLLGVVALAITSITSVAGSILRGANLDFKAAPARSLLSLLTPLAGALAVLAGTGIVGLATIAIVLAAISGWITARFVKRYVSWVGIKKPKWHDLKVLLGNSTLFVFVTQAQTVMQSTDILVSGWMEGAAAAGHFAATGMLVRFCCAPFAALASSNGASIAALVVHRKWEDLDRWVSEFEVLNLVYHVLLLLILVPLNGFFISHFFDARFRVDLALTTAIVVQQYSTNRYRLATVLADAAGAYRVRAAASGIGAVSVAGLSVIGAKIYGLAGISAAYSVGLMVSAALLTGNAKERFCRTFGRTTADSWRLALVAVAIISMVQFIGRHFESLTDTWAATGWLIFAVMVGALFWKMALNTNERLIVQESCRFHLKLVVRLATTQRDS
jgi:O-antigen/teichoic acid export membrane protein